jgi:hypothetical protein
VTAIRSSGPAVPMEEQEQFRSDENIASATELVTTPEKEQVRVKLAPT